MQIYKTKLFNRWAEKEGLMDTALEAAVEELAKGLVDADLGGHVYKKRVGIRIACVRPAVLDAGIAEG